MSKKLENVVSEMENVLSNVLITVKTTHNYHYPRVVILLETWVSLVRSQVSLLPSVAMKPVQVKITNLSAVKYLELNKKAFRVSSVYMRL